MGVCPSSEHSKTNEIINRQINRDRRKFSEEFRILLLGSGESGKSTIFKQMKIIQINGGFSDEERNGFKNLVFRNCISEMKILSYHCIKYGRIHDENIEKAKNFLASVDRNVWNRDVAEAIKDLWKDDILKNVLNTRENNLQINDTADYFFDNVDKFMDPNYVPDDDDILRTRMRSVGIEEAEFKFQDMNFRMIDVGGQRSERRKWIHCFQDVINATVYCASLSEYDMTLREDSETNRMEESLKLFQEICNSRWFDKIPIILFLNKLDLFQVKIKEVPLQKYFPNYTGGADEKKGLDYIKTRYSEKARDLEKLFVHETIAVSTENIRFVFGAVRRTIIEKILNKNITHLFEA